MKSIQKMIGILLVVGCVASWADTYSIDTQSSVMRWEGKKVVGGHDGVVKIKEGMVTTNKATVAGTIIIDMHSIENRDLTDPTYKAKLEGHLKNADFFDVETYPTATFVITKARETKQGSYVLDGDLTIKDKTHPITFDAVVTPKGAHKKLNARFSIDRTKWGVVYNSKGFFDIKSLGDKLILDEIKFDLNITLIKK
ncbi:MAG: YceI family protein [Fibrobacterales bacterium]